MVAENEAIMRIRTMNHWNVNVRSSKPLFFFAFTLLSRSQGLDIYELHLRSMQRVSGIFSFVSSGLFLSFWSWPEAHVRWVLTREKKPGFLWMTVASGEFNWAEEASNTLPRDSLLSMGAFWEGKTRQNLLLGVDTVDRGRPLIEGSVSRDSIPR